MSRLIQSILAAGFIAGVAISTQAEAETRVTGYQTTTVGTTRITALYKGFITDSASHEPVAFAYKRLISGHAGQAVSKAADIAAFVVDTGDKVTVVCVGDAEPSPALRGYLMSSLVAAGYHPDDIDEITIAATASSL